MNREQPPVNDIELLSAFIDGELSDAERIELNNRLENEPALKAELDSLQTTVDILHSLPLLKAPRDFRLDPVVYGRKTGGGIIRLSTWRVVSAVGVAAAVVLVAGSLLLGGTGDNAGDESAGSQIAFDPSTQLENEGDEQIEAIIPPSETALQFAGGVTSDPNANIPAVEEAEAEADGVFADDELGDDDLESGSDQSAEEPVEEDATVPRDTPIPAAAPSAVPTSPAQQAPEAMGGSMEAADTFDGEGEMAGENGRSADTEDRDDQETEEGQAPIAGAVPSATNGWAWIDVVVSGLMKLVVSLTELIYSILLGR